MAYILKSSTTFNSFTCDIWLFPFLNFKGINALKKAQGWSKEDIVDIFNRTLPNFRHSETGKYLDGKM